MFGGVDARTERANLAPAAALAAVLAVLLRAAPALFGAAVVGATGLLLLAVAVQAAVGRSVDRTTRRWVFRTTVLVYAVHVGLGLLISSSALLKQALGPDADTYHEGARLLADGWNGDVLAGPLLAVGREAFFYGLGGLYYLFGPHRVLGLIANAAFAAAVLPLVFDTTRRLFGDRSARVAALMVAVLPGFLIWTSQLLREAPIVFVLAVVSNASIRAASRATGGAYAVLAAGLVSLFMMRPNVAIVAVGAIAIALIVGRGGVAGVTTGATVVLLVAVLVLAAGVGFAGYRSSTTADLETVNVVRQALARNAASGIAPDADISTPSRAIAFLPYALTSFAVGPFPWQLNNARQVGLLLEAGTLWFLAPSLWRGYRAARVAAGRRRVLLTIPALALATMLALLIGNFGTVVRERLQIEVFLVPIAAYGWTLREGRKRSRNRPTAPTSLAGRAVDVPGDRGSGLHRVAPGRGVAGPG